ncbi:MRC1-like domain-containing protein [Colletotrichum orchidophilum]|uniref:MRC1-like domain-containing protein n=1 Tax=Colletotrichum orchidophilum TaxID=1209926 RepID=A0A1G4BCL7_9PEZI|nr:MRC1-like domain-containing protein [Colletotrichum orchidophilum]OHE99144.1 MRC1-like domain-containing protein [Colletotrichum orchidophilum]
MASEKAASRSPSASPAPETMKSRMEARLAAVDTSSEDDESSQPIRKSKSPPHATQASDSEEEVIFRPRGRLAAQLKGGIEPSDAEDEPESFMDRIQRRLGSKNDDDLNEEEEDATMGDAEEEEDVPVAPRRLQRKQDRQFTPPPPQSPAARSSPGLFVSPDRQSPIKPANATTADDASDSDASLPSLTKNARFQALVERKKQERLAREAEEEKKRAERQQRQPISVVDLFDDDEDTGNVSDITDDEGGRKLSQAARPTRKAGKKAVEEMARETQRMARNMQLAHEAKTRKKFTKADFLQRFNFGAQPKSDPKLSSSSRPTTPVSAHQTDAEMKEAETPPSSPPVAKTTSPAKLEEPTTIAQPIVDSDDNGDMSPLDDVFELSRRVDKGKGRAVTSPKETLISEVKPRRHVRIKLPAVLVSHAVIDLDDDDEMAIGSGKNSKLDAIFNRAPKNKAQGSRSLLALRRLARVGSPTKERKRKYEKATITTGQLQMSLQQRARQQAKMEREKRLEYLKSKGVVVQTAEEREREMQEVEDIVSRARREAEEIMEREREAAKEEKREKRKNGELDVWDDSDDESWDGSEEEVEGGVEIEVELSGSDDEGADVDEDVSEPEMEGAALFDNEADDSGSEHPEAEAEVSEVENDPESEDDMGLPTRNIRRSKKSQVISDDEDEDRIEATPRPRTATQQSPIAPNTKSPAVPTSVLRSAKKTFIPGLPVTGAAGLGLTQIFAGTMDDSQAVPGTIPSQSPMPDFDSLPDSNLMGLTQHHDSLVLDSQSGDTQRAETQPDSAEGVHLHFTQSQARGFDSFLRDDEPFTQISMDATQDAGPQDYTPLKQRFVDPPPSTVDTMVLERDAEVDSVQESPLVRRGKLRRKIDVAATVVDDEDNEESRASPEVDEFGFQTTAFNVMKEAVKKQKQLKKAEEYNRKKSKAKEMVEEQADESEDEYAGLGGVDGEDSDDDDDAASVKEMIDDENGMTADDERKLAALHADNERQSDEKMVDKLFHDITTGMLRRKRGADYDLSDSDDGGEARRRLKRRQFQKMQQALFADERIKKIAEKPGNQAFLRTIEDRGSDEEMDFLDFAPEPMETEASQSQEQQQTVPDSQPAAQRPPLASNATNVPSAANARRTKDGKKPSNLGEIRESVSSLLEDFNEVVPATDPHSDSEADDEEGHPSTSPRRGGNKENRSPGKNPRRTNSRQVVVDRLTMKRQSSSNMSTTSAKLAFAMPNAAGSAVGPSGGGGGGSSFRVPALLRRATTNSSVLSSQGSGGSVGGIRGSEASNGAVSFSARGGGGGGFGDDGKIKKNASKKSGVSALARENERRAAIQENEKRREARKWKGAERRHQAVNGLFGSGKFE